MEKYNDLVQTINKLEVISDTITGTLEFYTKVEEHFKESTDSNKFKIFICNTNEALSKIIDEFWTIINKS